MEVSKVYKGGAATGVCCASCLSTSTSGSWRKGWNTPGGKPANLCNRCGQRWAKDKRSVAAEAGVPVEATAADVGKKRRPLEEEEESDGSDCTYSSQKRLKEPGAAPDDTGTWPRALAVPTPAKQARLPGPSQTIPPAAAAAPAPTPAPQQQQKQQQQKQQQQQPSRPAVKFVSYAIQKQTSAKGNHALFWLQDEYGGHTLAVVGTDARLSGHFLYATSPDFTAAPPLRCTNRAEVTAWLASFGVTELAQEDSVGPLPELDAAERKRLLTGEPVWAKPQLEAGVWVGVREESGRLVDGRHFKRFFLLGREGQEKLAVTGLDSMRKDRRYKYFAEEALGGFAFENSREVLDWLNFALDRPANDPIEPQQVRAAKPLTEQELGTAAASRQPSLTVRTKPPAAPRPAAARVGKEAAGEDKPDKGRRRPSAPAAAVATGGPAGPTKGLAAQQQAGAGWAHSASGGAARAYAAGASAGALAQRSASEPLTSPSAPAVPFGGKVRPMPLAIPRFRCACCGMTDHDTEECPLAALSPTMLIRRPTLDKGIFQDPSLMSMPSPAALLLAPSPTTPAAAPGPPLGTASASGAGAGSQRGLGGVLEFNAGERSVTTGVKEAYQEFPRLQQWVAAVPSNFTVETFRTWADRLGGHISDHPPPPSASPEEEPLGGWRWVPTAEALAILRTLSTAQVNLALLESTQISRAVAMLRTHRNDEVAALAEAIVAKWRSCAVAALHHATAALEHTT